MKIALWISLCLFTACAGIERMQAHRKTNSQLRLRLSQTERELSSMRFGDGALHDFNMLEAERDAIERELLSRCEGGDQEACR